MTNQIFAIFMLLMAFLTSDKESNISTEIRKFVISSEESYKVKERGGPIVIDADWDKPVWKRIPIIKLKNYMGKVPSFRPKTEAKVMYDKENIYVIFRVRDKFVRSVVREYNGNVSGDSCVEFFFAPDANAPEKYFNLEINAGGTPLIFFVSKPWTDFVKLDPVDIAKIEIAHSMPEVVDPEITDSVTWTIEYRIPIAILEKYSPVTTPESGVIWKANFYKTASKSTNPHWITWSPVEYPKPNFHLPQYFGKLEFQ
ncbi:carbohydrate-binding family 9-like protein [Membranihabitans maritimus]|uniref:carbohydrate-binding family 9-like protein n=1 Tax=Membranihabitans maritimus TaxID=2904244 RepID=UPI001F422FAB|nr:carbohydrate-binding family 9-like protein [Membranihabitans maritimus]